MQTGITANQALMDQARRLQSSDPAASVRLYQKVLETNPQHVEAHFLMGIVQTQLGDFDLALASFGRALAGDPGNPAARYARGLLLAQLGHADAALQDFDALLQLQPNNAVALFERGRQLRRLGRPAEALYAYDRAIALQPGNARLWNARGTLLMEMNRPEEALAAYSEAIARDPGHVDALVNRGQLQWTQWRRYKEAVADLERAVLLAPRHNRQRGELLHIRMFGADWHNFEAEKALLDEGVRQGELVVQPFAYQAISDSPADLAACARTFARLYPTVPAPEHPRRRDGKIRIGYASAEFRDHATAYLMAGVYEAHDRGAFEVIAIDNGHDDGSAMRRRLEAGIDRFVDISQLGDAAAAARIRAESIDILVNLNGYFGSDRMGVFARRAAPIQVNYLGFPGTLGAPYIDYLVADSTVIPQDERGFYDEKIVTLPGCYQANDAARIRPREIPDRAACGLPDNAFVFCNFNQSYKFTPATFAAWMRIMARIPDSVLWLIGDLPTLRANLKQAAGHHGIAAERIIFATHEPIERHLARLPQADLMLDSLPYNAHTTASDALWMGVPLVTCRGTTFPGRVAASMLQAIGMEELVAENMADFEALAVALAADRKRLARLCEKLAANRRSFPLFDTRRFTRNIETAYHTMHKRWLAGEAPAAFDIT